MQNGKNRYEALPSPGEASNQEGWDFRQRHRRWPQISSLVTYYFIFEYHMTENHHSSDVNEDMFQEEPLHTLVLPLPCRNGRSSALPKSLHTLSCSSKEIRMTLLLLSSSGIYGVHSQFASLSHLQLEFRPIVSMHTIALSTSSRYFG